jgi:hypothetical protein|tara:strand:- start:284 stop:445 length:162 start_codon:yes stop_codon:yes gene_type:complete
LSKKKNGDLNPLSPAAGETAKIIAKRLPKKKKNNSGNKKYSFPPVDYEKPPHY